RYRTLFDGVPVGLYRTTPAGQIMDANLAMVQMLGYPSREDLVAINTASLYVDPEERVRWKALMEREGVVRDFEIRNRRYDGTVIWVNNTARAVRDEQGQVLYYEGSLEDITERKQAEEELRRYQEHLEELVEERTAELRESEERYRTLFDGVPVGLFRATLAGEMTDANLAMVQMLGYPSREDVLAIDPASLYVDPEERVQWKALMEREGVARDVETQVYQYDGTVIWVSTTGRAVRDEQGQVLYYEGSLADITERKKLGEELYRQKDYFEALFVNSPVAALTADLDGSVVSWNPMAEKLFGYTQEEAIGRNVDDLVANDARVREEALGYTHQISTKGRIQATTKRTRKDGSLIDVEVRALPVVVAGELVGYVAIYHDIGELQEARREAEQASQAKSAFLATMSHEIRTPMNAVIGMTSLLLDTDLTPEQREFTETIRTSGDTLLTIINDILDFSKIEAGKLELEDQPFDLRDCIEGALDLLATRAAEKGLDLAYLIETSCPAAIFGDVTRLSQILVNLLSNAVK
ncbi:MAG: PAS domain S-box protein, partial [Anaerolineae bacterium]|nr:PAS domain S-box protein [Anaerolineae bacterium]